VLHLIDNSASGLGSIAPVTGRFAFDFFMIYGQSGQVWELYVRWPGLSLNHIFD
jgi:hypothetical protein